MAKKIGTIDFDGRTIRVLIARGNEVLHWASTSVAADLMNQGLIGRPEGMAEQIAGLLGSDGIPRRCFVTSLTAHRAASRVLILPKVKPRFLDEAVRRKAKQEMPLPMQETYLTWQVVGSQHGQLQVYAFAVPRNIVDQQVHTLKAAGLKPRAMDLKPLALARAVGDPNCIVVNLEDQGFGVVLVANGAPEILRSVPQTAEEASPKERVEKLSQELDRTIRFYEEAHRGSTLPAGTRVYATGLLLESEEIRGLLAARTPYPVALPKPPMSLPDDFPVAAFSANLGLAMKDL
jgi:hypothetical protein